MPFDISLDQNHSKQKFHHVTGVACATFVLSLLGAGACGSDATTPAHNGGHGGSGQAAGAGGSAGGSFAGAAGAGAAGTGGGAGNGALGGRNGAAGAGGGPAGGAAGGGELGGMTGAGGTAGGMAGGAGGGPLGGTGGGPLGGAAGSGPVAPHAPWTDLSQGQLNVQGGTASSPGGVGQDGGLVHVIAGADTTFDPSQPGVAAPVVPAVPAGVTTITSAMLNADVTAGGDATFDASAIAGGSDAVRTVVAGGSLFVTGQLRSADLGSARQGLVLHATDTIYVTGTVDTSGGPGQAGGPITLIANQVVITGHVLSAGGASDTAGGAAGSVTIQATTTVTMTGEVDCSGGNVNGAAAVTGGAAANLKIQAGGNVGLGGVVLFRGGGAASTGPGPATGGTASSLVFDSNGGITLGGIIDGRGGLAKAATAGGAVVGGAAGQVHVGESAPPTSLVVVVPLVATGGDGAATAGAGGTLTPEPGTGTINIAGPHEIDLSGGNSMRAPGAGGTMNGSPRKDPGTGGVHVTGDITLNGGSILPGGSGDGAGGGNLKISVTPTDGPVAIDQSANIVASGGSSGGAGKAGGGGHVWFWTKDGDITCAGHVTVNGGDAPDPGGTGGLGGMIYFFTDLNGNAVEVPLGNLWITSTGVLTASGGAGTVGGSARNNGVGGGSVSGFSNDPTDPAYNAKEQIAILLNGDGEHGNTNNWMQNDGWLYADGGAAGGNGGDIVYHGIPPGAHQAPDYDPNGDYPVPSGNIQNNGDGTGVKGDFAGE